MKAVLEQNEELSSFLRSGLHVLELELSLAVQEKIVQYVRLLHKWNQAYNLTAVREPKAILIRHIFDSLAITRFIKGSNVLDFGTGAGLPGIPLALVLPQHHFFLLDSSSKKTTFLNHALLELGVKNVTVVTKRIEAFDFVSGFATIVTRATTTLAAIFDKAQRLLAKDGQILVMKGKYPSKELKEMAALNVPTEVYPVQVPYLDEERHLVQLLMSVSGT